LKAQLTARKQQKQFKQKVATRQMLKGHKSRPKPTAEAETEENLPGPSKVDQLLNLRMDPAQDDDSDGTDESEDDLESLESFQGEFCIPATCRLKRGADDVAGSKMDMKALKDQDPEFYKVCLRVAFLK
jgi:hypothetical protein